MRSKESAKEIRDLVELSRVRLNKNVLDQLNLYQAGGSGSEILEEKDFSNDHVNEEIKKLTELFDFIFDLHYSYDFDDTPTILKHLCYIKNLQCHFQNLKPFPDEE